MNLIEARVTKVLEKPKEKYNHWWVKVAYEDIGGTGETELMFNTESKAILLPKIGYLFLH